MRLILFALSAPGFFEVGRVADAPASCTPALCVSG